MPNQTRSNLSIERDILRSCREKKIRCSRDYCNSKSVNGVPIKAKDGYVCASFWGADGKRIEYVVEYLSFERWYFKFERMRHILASVEISKPEAYDIKQQRYTTYRKQREVMRSLFGDSD